MSTGHTEIILRSAADADAAALDRLAQLDSRPLPPGPHLVAERAGAIEAAISLRDGEIVANPFVRTAELRELLRLHASPQTAEARPRRGLRPRPLTAPA